MAEYKSFIVNTEYSRVHIKSSQVPYGRGAMQARPVSLACLCASPSKAWRKMAVMPEAMQHHAQLHDTLLSTKAGLMNSQTKTLISMLLPSQLSSTLFCACVCALGHGPRLRNSKLRLPQNSLP